MAEIDTWMPWHIADYLADTMHLSTLEHGAYLLILAHGWRNGGKIACGDGQMAKVTRMPLDQWKAIRPTIEAFFEPFTHPTHGACWKQKRQVEEIERAKAQKEKAHDKAVKANKARWASLEHPPSNAPSNPQALLDDSPQEGKGKGSSNLPPEGIAYKPPVRSQESAAHGAAIRAAGMEHATQTHYDRAKAASDAYPIRSKDGRNVKKDLGSMNLLAIKIARAPDFPWLEAATLENLNETPQDFANWVSSQPDPVMLETRRKQKSTPPPPKPGERPVKKLQELND